MFCSNCGAVLAEGAKFCSECGTKVEDTQAKVFDNLAFDEPAGVQGKVEERAMSMEEAFKEKVSFDWSNVIDEPQKKEVPQEIRSPWAATTGNIDERDLYAEMGKSDDKNRTMNFIDVLRADKEERERAALDKSIEYTEVLEIDPELIGGVKPPKMHYAPLYEDVDEPVKTPFDFDETVDAYATGQLDRLHIEENTSAEASRVETPVSEPNAPKFELPDFLKKAKDLVGANDNAEVERIERPEAIAEDFLTATIDDVEEVVEDKAEETVAEAVEDAASAVTDDTANLYLDLDVLSNDAGTERVSRATAHALAGDYDDDDDSETEESNKAVDENELFSEMNETLGAKPGMTIAAPADEEAEIEALKRRLAELTGTLEIDPSLLNESEGAAEAEPELDDYTFEPEATPVDETVSLAAPGLEDFFFEPEVTPAEDKLFEELTAASETSAAETETPVLDKTDIELPAEERYEPEQSMLDNPAFDIPSQETTKEPEAPVQITEPEVTAPITEPETVAPITGLEAPAQTTEPEAAAPIAEPEIAAPAVGLEAVAPIAEPEPPTVGLEPAPAVIDFASMMAEKAVDEPPKPTDAVSLEDLENDLFGPVDDAEEVEAESTKKIDKFYTLYRKNEEFQRLLDEEYSKLKGEHIEISEEEVNKELGIGDAVAPSAAVTAVTADATEKAAEEAAPAAAASMDIAAALGDISADSRPVEDATIYQDMPEELKALTRETEEKAEIATAPASEVSEPKNEKKSKGLFGKSKEKKNKKKEEGGASFGLNGEDVPGAATNAVATTAEAADSSLQISGQPEVAYQDVDSGSTILTILAVLVAILLVFLLAIILIMHLAPYSEIALMVDQVIENITSRFGAVDTMQGLKLL